MISIDFQKQPCARLLQQAAALRAPGVSVKEGCGTLQNDHQATLSRNSTLETLTNGAFRLF
jgi:hypothetical protein